MLIPIKVKRNLGIHWKYGKYRFAYGYGFKNNYSLTGI